MNGEEWRELREKLSDIKTDTAVSAEKLDILEERFDTLNGTLDEVRIKLITHLAECEGIEREANRNASKHGAIWGGGLGALIIAVKAVFE